MASFTLFHSPATGLNGRALIVRRPMAGGGYSGLGLIQAGVPLICLAINANYPQPVNGDPTLYETGPEDF